MGSPSLIIVLIIVVWVIVLAPMVLGSNKPIRRSGDGYDETRVLHEGGTVAVTGRRRPKLTAADVHRHADDEDYEVVEAVGDFDEEPILIDDASAPSTALDTVPAGEVVLQDGDTDGAAESADTADAADTAETAPRPGWTAYSVLKAQRYEVDETFLGPEDFGYEAHETHEDHEAADTSDDAESPDASSGAIVEHDDTAPPEVVEADDADIAFAESRRGRGGYDPRRDAATRADRYKRRQRTFAGLLAADVIALVIAVVAGGWAWLLPAATVGLTVWFLVALRRLVKQEQALRARRMRQLRRARLGVDLAENPPVVQRERRRAGAVVVDMDDESPDFAQLPTYRAPEPAAPTHRRVIHRARDNRDYEAYDDYDRAS